jgi:hypothetical protein
VTGLLGNPGALSLALLAELLPTRLAALGDGVVHDVEARSCREAGGGDRGGGCGVGDKWRHDIGQDPLARMSFPPASLAAFECGADSCCSPRWAGDSSL